MKPPCNEAPSVFLEPKSFLNMHSALWQKMPWKCHLYGFWVVMVFASSPWHTKSAGFDFSLPLLAPLQQLSMLFALNAITQLPFPTESWSPDDHFQQRTWKACVFKKKGTRYTDKARIGEPASLSSRKVHRLWQSSPTSVPESAGGRGRGVTLNPGTRHPRYPQPHSAPVQTASFPVRLSCPKEGGERRPTA